MESLIMTVLDICDSIDHVKQLEEIGQTEVARMLDKKLTHRKN